MKRLIVQPLLYIAILLAIASCKEESEKDYFSVTGRITAGESVSAEELLDIEIRLGLLKDTVNTHNITTKSNIVFEKVIKTPVDEEGSFTILNLDYGNYILSSEPGFIFIPDTFIIVKIDGFRTHEYLRAVEKITLDSNW